MRKILICSYVLALSACAFASSQPGDASLKALPTAAQSAISSTLGRDSSLYAVHRITGGFQAENHNRRINWSFTSQGVQANSQGARWQMLLNAYGYGANLKPVAAVAPEANANRVEYKHGSLREWYLNGPAGLEQGFTLSERPADAGTAAEPLTVSLALSGNMRALANSAADAVTLTDAAGNRLRYAGLSAYDADGKELHSWLEVRGDQLLLHVADAGARYPLTIDPFINEAILTSTDDAFGFGVSVSSSGDTIVAGSGSAAYVFVKPSSGWTSATQAARLTASNGTILASVAISGNTIVAAPGFSYFSDTGYAFVFVKPATGWTDMTETAILTASDAPESYGASVGINGNVIAIGAVESGSVGSRDPSGSGPGAVYVYVRPSGGWTTTTETAKLTASDGVTGDDLGYSVAVGENTIVAGAPDNVVNGVFASGASYVFTKPTSGWASETQTAKLSVLNEGDAVAFGTSVAISGNTIVGGAFGGVWVYVEPAGGWTSTTQTAQLSDSSSYITTLGLSVSICNNVVVAGARAMADVFIEPTGGWTNMTQTSRLPSPNGKLDGNYGNGVNINGLTITVGFPALNETNGNQVFVWAPVG
jgi:hypothetical protein